MFKLYQECSGSITNQRMGAWVNQCFVEVAKEIVRESYVWKTNDRISRCSCTTRARCRIRIRTRRRNIQDCDARIFKWATHPTTTRDIYQLLLFEPVLSSSRTLLLLSSLSLSQVFITAIFHFMILDFHRLFLYSSLICRGLVVC